MKLIDVKKMNLNLDGKKILENIKFHINENEVKIIVGKSGSGKTQLIKTLTSYENIKDDLEIDFNIEKKDIAIIFQNFDELLNPLMRIDKQIIEYQIYHKLLNREEAIKKAKDLFLKLNIKIDVLKKYPFEISGGEKQRVVLAMILMQDPKLIICDEITSALDLDNEIAILKLLLSLNISILMITHSITTMKKFSKNILFIEEGKIIFEGNLENLLKLDNDYVKKLRLIYGE